MSESVARHFPIRQVGAATRTVPTSREPPGILCRRTRPEETPLSTEPPAHAGPDAAVYPVGLRLQGRRVVVVGGGQVAHRRVAGLLDAGARVTVVSPEVTPALEAVVTPGSLRWVRRRYEPGDLDGAWYAVAATDDSAVNAAVGEEAERLRIFCARADDRRASSVWTPAIGRHDDVVVGVHGGGDPQRAIGVRDAGVAGAGPGATPPPAPPPPPPGGGGAPPPGGGGAGG